MSECWTEGELRAYLDGELPPRDTARVAAHLKECTACAGLHAELEGRARCVAKLVAVLPEPAPVIELPKLARRSGSNGRWAGVAAAAVLAVAFLLLPKPRKEVPVIAPAPQPPVARAPLKPPPAAPTPAPPPMKVRPAIIRRKLPAPPKPQLKYFVALDNEPIETGIVVRVGLDGGQIPADVILGPDGRARAFRLVSDSTGER